MPRNRRRLNMKPTPEELVVWKLFPQAVWNKLIRTGLKQSNGSAHWFKLDIAFMDLKLDVEIDGGVHRIPGNGAKDARRTKILEGLGWTVLRFWNHEVLKDITKVKKAIQSTILKLKAIQVTP